MTQTCTLRVQTCIDRVCHMLGDRHGIYMSMHFQICMDCIKCPTFPEMGSSTLDIFLLYFNSSILLCQRFWLRYLPHTHSFIMHSNQILCLVPDRTSTSQSTWRRAKSQGQLGCCQAQSRWPSVGVTNWAALALKQSVLMNRPATSWQGWGGGLLVQRQTCSTSVLVKYIHIL